MVDETKSSTSDDKIQDYQHSESWKREHAGVRTGRQFGELDGITEEQRRNIELQRNEIARKYREGLDPDSYNELSTIRDTRLPYERGFDGAQNSDASDLKFRPNRASRTSREDKHTRYLGGTKPTTHVTIRTNVSREQVNQRIVELSKRPERFSKVRRVVQRLRSFLG